LETPSQNAGRKDDANLDGNNPVKGFHTIKACVGSNTARNRNPRASQTNKTRLAQEGCAITSI